ncbi:MAG: VanZ family protein [Pygmaiobacter massiliensis]|nr:VanZ family protein [Pygmaiobacter massiliensis]
MDIFTVLQALLRWGTLALAGGIAVFLVLVGAWLFYKKVFSGKRSLSKGQIVCAGLLCCWFVLVLGLTSLSRGSNFTGSVNISFMSGYLSAWNNWSVSERQLIVFNMLMFAPLGFLLPLLWKRAQSFGVTAAVSLGVTGLIEVFQLMTGTGIFELDDLFHNLVGSIFGYLCIMAVVTLLREKTVRMAPIARAMLIPSIMALVLGAVFCAYQLKPYGNMSILPAVRQDMSKVELVAQWQMPDHYTTAAVYKSKFAADKTYRQTVKAGFAEREGVTFSQFARREDENLGYMGTNAQGTECRILFFVRTGEWNYTTFAPNAAQLTEQAVQEQRQRYEEWMKQQNLFAQQAQFSVQNGDTLRWDIGLEQDSSQYGRSF